MTTPTQLFDTARALLQGMTSGEEGFPKEMACVIVLATASLVFDYMNDQRVRAGIKDTSAGQYAKLLRETAISGLTAINLQHSRANRQNGTTTPEPVSRFGALEFDGKPEADAWEAEIDACSLCHLGDGSHESGQMTLCVRCKAHVCGRCIPTHFPCREEPVEFTGGPPPIDQTRAEIQQESLRAEFPESGKGRGWR